MKTCNIVVNDEDCKQDAVRHKIIRANGTDNEIKLRWCANHHAIALDLIIKMIL